MFSKNCLPQEWNYVLRNFPIFYTIIYLLLKSNFSCKFLANFKNFFWKFLRQCLNKQDKKKKKKSDSFLLNYPGRNDRDIDHCE